MEIESHLSEFLQGIKISDFGQLSGKQIMLIDKLHRKSIVEERKLSSKLASLQEDVVDQPIITAAKNSKNLEITHFYLLLLLFQFM